MANILDILTRAQALRQETALNSITPDRAGGIMYDTLILINQMQLEGGSLLISKVYSSVAAMEADTTPTSDLTGRALRPGQLAVIVPSSSSSSDMGSVYRYNEPGSWTLCGKIGGLPLDTAPIQGSSNGITSGAVYTALSALKNEGYKYMGIATPGSGGTAPGTPNQPVFYVAAAGSYPNFGSLTVASGHLGFLKYSNGSWTVESIEVGKDYDEEISQLQQKVDDFAGLVENGNADFSGAISPGNFGEIFRFPLRKDANVTVKVTARGGNSNARLYGVKADGTTSALTNNYQLINQNDSYDFVVTADADYAGIRVYQSSASTATSADVSISLTDPYATESLLATKAEKDDMYKLFERGNINLSTFAISKGNYSTFAIRLYNGGKLQVRMTPNNTGSVRVYGWKESGNTKTALMDDYQALEANTEAVVPFTVDDDYDGLYLYFPSGTLATSAMGVLEPLTEDYVTNAELSSAISPLATKVQLDAATNYEKKNWQAATSILTQVGFIRPSNGTQGTNSSYVCSDYLRIDGVKRFVVKGYFNTVNAPIAYYNSSKTFISAESVSSDGAHTVNSTVPNNAFFIRVSTLSNKISDFSIDAILGLSSNAVKLDRVFMSPNGDDTNAGTESTPVATFAVAKNLLREGGELFMLPGTYENAGILNLSDFAKITGISKVRLFYYTQKITSATLVSGNIYKVAFVGGTTLASLTKYLYIHDVADPDTEILSAEKHPLQKGQTHRLPSTRIYQVSTLAEVESTTSHHCWYTDGTDIYFSIPEGTDLSTNPVIVPARVDIGATEKRTVEIRNIDFLYCGMTLTGLSGLFENVSCGMGRSRAGQIRCDYCKDLVLRNCEAYAAHTASGGDGVNTHNTDTTISDQSRIVLENCWLHDNGDDGESCHENSLTIHHGGLYEYNGNGITPASGGGSDCHGCLVRRSGNQPWVTDNGGTGFSSQGGVLTCFDCVSENNVVGYNVSSGSFGIAYNSIAKGNATQFRPNFSQVNCVSLT